ncbi:MAG: hypothetical protein N4A33_01215 [Bacteriovoracaceae bacterium]|jgi:hypothetical protein|nr:hypothetical protein [Bacteriovoracaceae bacterium]
MVKLFVLIFSFSVFAKNEGFVHFKERNKLLLSSSFGYEFNSLETDDSNTSEVKSSTFGILGSYLTADYFFTSKISFNFKYYFALVLDIDAEVQGFSVGGKYYFSDGASKEVEFAGSSLNAGPQLAYYIGVDLVTRDYQFATVNLRFQGFDFNAGADWHFGSRYFLRAEGSFKILSNNNIRTLTNFGARAVIGFKY